MKKIIIIILTLLLFYSCDTFNQLTSSDENAVVVEESIDEPEVVEEEKESLSGVEVLLDDVLLTDNIKPNHKTETELLADISEYYDYYKTKYIKESNGNTPGGGYYVLAGSTGYTPSSWGDEQPKSNSEAHGYGMIISALMDDKNVFDGMFNMFENYKSTINPALMSWIIPVSEDQEIPKTDSATDGDMDIAYALILADKVWGSDGDINYLAQATAMIEAFSESLIGDNNAVLMGDWCKTSGVKYSTATRSSDWFPAYYEIFESLTSDSKWTDVNDTIYETILPNVANADTGLVPDFVKGDYTAPDGEFLETEYDGDYNWNACRYPWRQSLGYIHAKDEATRKNIKFHMLNVASFVKETIGSSHDFDSIKAGYYLDGEAIAGRSYSSGAFISPMVCSLIIDPENQIVLNDGWDFILEIEEGYFSDSITMLSLMTISGIWFNPSDI